MNDGYTCESYGHGHHVSDAGQDHRHCEGDLYPGHDLPSGAAHTFCGFQDCGIYVGHTGVCVANHREKGIDRQGDDGSGVSYPGKGNQESQHRYGRYRIQEINDAQRRLRALLILADEDTRQAPEHDGDHDRRHGYLNMLQQQSSEKVPFRGQERPDFSQHFSILSLRWPAPDSSQSKGRSEGSDPGL